MTLKNLENIGTRAIISISSDVERVDFLDLYALSKRQSRSAIVNNLLDEKRTSSVIEDCLQIIANNLYIDFYKQTEITFEQYLPLCDTWLRGKRINTYYISRIQSLLKEKQNNAKNDKQGLDAEG